VNDGTSLSPTRAVLATIEAGAGSVAEIARRTGLDTGVVGLAIERLVTSGHLSAQRLQAACPTGGCHACPSGLAGRPGCSAAASSRHDGPVLVSLTSAR
jgi:hypothetical protein